MKPAHSNPDQLWRAYVIAQSKFQEHQLSVPPGVIRARAKRVRVRVQILKVAP